jgi:pimeloyl-ACP methyl ester carboxylesterase
MTRAATIPRLTSLRPDIGDVLDLYFSPISFPYVHFSDRDHIPIGYTDSRTGEPVILLHSSTSSGRQWLPLKKASHAAARKFNRTGQIGFSPHAGASSSKTASNATGAPYRWMILDLYGYGESGYPCNTQGYRLDREVDLVEHLLNSVKGPVHLVGNGLGGAVAFLTAIRRPDRVRSICVHEPLLFNLLKECRCDVEWAEVETLSLRFQGMLSSGRPEHALEMFVDFWCGTGAFYSLPGKRRYEMVRSAGKIALDFEALNSVSIRLSEFASLPCPVLITSGATSPQCARKVAGLLGGAFGADSLQMIEGAGHMALLTHTDEMTARILAHLDRHRIG